MTDLMTILATKYQPPHWVFIREFRNATGFDATRSADALAFGLYRSRGQVIVGFEQKTSRSDWLRELKNPSKAEPIAQFCDFFNVVVPELSIIGIDELPAPWGLIVIDQEKRKVQYIKKAEKLTAIPLSRSFLCALVKQAMDTAQLPGEQQIRESRDAGYQDGFKSSESGRNYELDRLRKLAESVAAFEKASGVAINGYDGEQIGEAVSVVRAFLGGEKSRLRDMKWAERELAEALEQIRKGITAVESIQPKQNELQVTN